MSTKTSSGYNSFFYQQSNKPHQKLNDVEANPEVISDLHLKMSKKIAQLTKVKKSCTYVI